MQPPGLRASLHNSNRGTTIRTADVFQPSLTRSMHEVYFELITKNYKEEQRAHCFSLYCDARASRKNCFCYTSADLRGLTSEFKVEFALTNSQRLALFCLFFTLFSY